MECKNILTKDAVEKLKKLYQENRTMMYNEARGILKDHGLAEDAVQQAFMKIVNDLERYPEKEMSRGFLRVVVRNIAIDMYNKRKKDGTRFEYMDELKNETLEKYLSDTNPLDKTIENENYWILRRAVDKLPKIYRDVMLLEITGEFKQREIAERLNVSHSVVKKRVERARKMLKKLGKEEID